MKKASDPRQADRKALPKFLLIVVAGMALGILCGFLGLSAVEDLGQERISSFVAGAGNALSAAAPWLMALCAAAQLVCGLAFTGRAKRIIDGWDGEDEAVSDRADRLLEWELAVSAMVTVLEFFFLTAYFAGERFPYGRMVLILSLGFFALAMSLTVGFQTRAVNLTKRLYPEKTASALDVRFQKKWVASCDEAEKAMIGECAYHAYSATGFGCLVLWLVFSLSALFLGTGVLPALAVCLIWEINQGTYLYRAMKFSGASAGAV